MSYIQLEGIQNMSIENHNIIADDYFILPYPMAYSDLLEDNWADGVLYDYSWISSSFLKELSTKQIAKVPKLDRVLNYVLDFSNNLKDVAANEATLHKIDKKWRAFSDNFESIYEPHEQRLCTRIVRLNHINDLNAPDIIQKAEERLCVKQAALMLAIIKTCIPDFDTDICINSDLCNSK